MISLSLALASIVLCSTFGAMAAFARPRRNFLRYALAAVSALSFLVLALHVMALTGAIVVAGPSPAVEMFTPSEALFVLGAGGVIVIPVALVIAATCSLWWRKSLDEKTLQLEAALENMPQGLCMFDADGCVTIFNQRYATMMGFPSTSLNGRHLLDLMKELDSKRAQSMSPEDRAASVMSTIRSGNATSGILESPLGPILRVGFQPLQQGGWVATYEDITDQHNAEMREKVAFFSIDECPMSITIADATKPDMPLIFANRMFLEMTGYASNEVVGRNCRFLQGPATEPRVVEDLRKAMSAGTRADVQLVNYRKDGTEFLNHVVVMPVRDRAGRIVASIGFQSDVTHDASRQAEGQRQKMESLGRMMGGIAHEINNMLQPVTLLVQEVIDKGMVADEGKLHLGVVLDCSNKARLIIGDLLSFSKPVAPTAEVHDSVALLNENLPIVQQLIRSAIALSVRIDGCPRSVRINRTSFAQIVMNLAINAVGAMNGRGELTLALDEDVGIGTGAECRGRFVRLRVIDTGCGMDKATVDRAFEPFFTTKPIGQGTGLGLPVVYGLVHQMGGAITIDSELGVGTTVTVSIPQHNGEIGNGQNIDS